MSTENVNNQTPADTGSLPAPSATMNASKAIWQLRVLVCGLGLILFVVSGTLSVFVWKQDRNVSAETNARNTQIAQMQSNGQRFAPLLNELAQLTRDDQAVAAVFQRYNLSITARPDATAPPASPTP